MPLITFDPTRASEADILSVVKALGLTDASVPAPPPPVSLVRTLPQDTFPAYGGTEDITGKTAAQLGAMLQSGQITSREIVLQYLYRIQEYDHSGPALRAVGQINPDILQLADQADAERAAAEAAGQTLPALFGVPILVKENINTNDNLFTTAGSAALIGSRPTSDATLVSGLEAQGLLIMGKANMGQWAGIVSNSDSSFGGQTLNPYDPSLPVAGSSSGPSIAVSMHFAPATVGTQTSDSIIYPAEQEGIYALKPTAGLVSTTGVAPYSSYVDAAGPMANSVQDLALMLNGMVAQDQTDTRSQSYVRPADYSVGLNGDLSGMNVGVYDATPAEDPTRSPSFDATVTSMLTAAGANVVPLDRASLDAAVRTTILGLSDDDLAQFIGFADPTASIPTDATQRQDYLKSYRNSFTDGTNRWATAEENSVSLLFDSVVPSITDYLAQRVSSPQDYASAYIRLLGDQFTALGGSDPSVYAKTIADILQFAASNVSLDAGDFALARMPELSPSATTAALAAYANWIRISTSVMTGIRSGLGVDAMIGTLGDPGDANDATDGLAAFTFFTDQASQSPQLNVPAQIDGTPANIVIDANPYQEPTLLKIGAALQQQLGTDAFKQYQTPPPNPPASGFPNQPPDNGPLLPLVFDNLDDHGMAAPAHLLSTVMAPLTLNVTDAGSTPEFDGTISGDGGLIKEGLGTQSLTGISDFSGGVDVWQGGLAISSTGALGAAANALTLEAGSSLLAEQSFSFGRNVSLKNGGGLGAQDGMTFNVDGVISGNGGLVAAGLGEIVLSGANLYTGGTDIQQGTLAVSSDANLGADFGELTLGNGATLDATASFETHRQIHVDGNASIAIGAATTVTTTNVLDGSGSLTLRGPGTLDLEGSASPYSGDIGLSGGTLELGALDASGSGMIAFGTGSTLKLDSAVPGDVSFGDVLSNFTTGDALDLSQLAFNANTTASIEGSTLTVTNGIGTEAFTLNAPDVSGLNVTSDGQSGGTLVTGIGPAGPSGIGTGIGPTGPSGIGTGLAPTGPVANAAPVASALFGSIAHDVISPAGDVYALYETILGRAPDPVALEQDVAAIEQGASPRSIAHKLLTSDEYTSHYGRASKSSKAEFVSLLYENGLHRAVDQAGLQSWTHALSKGTSRAAVALEIARSDESRSDLAATFQAGVFVPDPTAASIARLYYSLLDRAPDAGGLARFETAAQQGVSLAHIASDMIRSPEYAGLHGTQSNAGFVEALFEGAFGRPERAGNAEGYVESLDAGASRGALAVRLVDSPEAVQHLSSRIETGFQTA